MSLNSPPICNDFQLRVTKKRARQVRFFIRLPRKKTAGEIEVWANLGAIVHLGTNFPLSLFAPPCDNLCYWPNFVFAFSSAAIRKSLALILARAPRACLRQRNSPGGFRFLSLRRRCFLPRYYLSSRLLVPHQGFPARRLPRIGENRAFFSTHYFFKCVGPNFDCCVMEGNLCMCRPGAQKKTRAASRPI